MLPRQMIHVSRRWCNAESKLISKLSSDVDYSRPNSLFSSDQDNTNTTLQAVLAPTPFLIGALTEDLKEVERDLAHEEEPMLHFNLDTGQLIR